MKQSKNCPNCRKIIQESFSLCPYCGTRLQLPDAKTDEQDLTASRKINIASLTSKTHKKVTVTDVIEEPEEETLEEEVVIEKMEEETFDESKYEDEETEDEDEYEEEDVEDNDEYEEEEEIIEEEVVEEIISPVVNKEPVRYSKQAEPGKKTQKKKPVSEQATTTRQRRTKPYDPNHDGYYDDVTPEVIESYRKGLQMDVLLKALFCIVGVIATIFYLIYA